MKRNSPRESTTATRPSRKVTISRVLALVVGLASSATAVTLPASVHTLGHYDVALAVIIGISPAILGLLALVVVLTVMTVYLVALTAALLVAGVVALGRLLRMGDGSPASAAEHVLISVINPLIALGTLSPLKPVRRVAEPLDGTTVSPMPAVPTAARTEATPFFAKLVRENPLTAEALRGAVPVGDNVSSLSRGRHARSESASAGAESVSSTSVTDRAA